LHNERLEFLGDAVLGFLITDTLYGVSAEREGALTRRRASLVRKESLAALARELCLGEFLVLGPGEQKSGGRNRDSILADALEAVIGAIYLDGGVNAVGLVVARLFAERLSLVGQSEVEKDAKTKLQERLQAERLALPLYEVHDVDDCADEPSFTVTCAVSEPPLETVGHGATRREAEQNAAARMLGRLVEVESADRPRRTP